MQSYMIQITRADGTTAQRRGEYSDGVIAALQQRDVFPDAVSIKVEPYADWLAQNPVQHDSEHLPAGGFYFAPGAVDPEPVWWQPRDRVGRAVQQLCIVLVVAGLLGGLAGYLQATGWPQ